MPVGGSRRFAAALVTGGGVGPPNVPGLSLPPIRLAAYPRQVAGLSRLSYILDESVFRVATLAVHTGGSTSFCLVNSPESAEIGIAGFSPASCLFTIVLINKSRSSPPVADTVENSKSCPGILSLERDSNPHLRTWPASNPDLAIPAVIPLIPSRL